MNYIILFRLILLFELLTNYFHPVHAQKFQVEPYMGLQHVHHHECNLEDKKEHRGCTVSSGLRFNFNLSKHWSIIPGYTLNNIIGNNFKFRLERIIRLDIRYNFAFNKSNPRMKLTAETGIEWVYFKKKIKFPLYLGFQYNLNSLTDLYGRIRLPNIMGIELLSLYQFVEISTEIGLAFNPNWTYYPKFAPTVGNPFILQ